MNFIKEKMMLIKLELDKKKVKEFNNVMRKCREEYPNIKEYFTEVKKQKTFLFHIIMHCQKYQINIL